MKVLFVNKLYAPDIGGGAELTLADLAVGVQAAGHEVLVATTTAGDRAVDDDVAGVAVTRLPLRNVYWHHGAERHGAFQRMRWHARDAHNAAMGSALGEVIRRFDPDVISFHNLAGFSGAAWDAASARRTPAIQVLHDYYHLCPRSQLFRDGRNCDAPCRSCSVFRRGRATQSNGLQAVVGVSHAVLDAHVRNGLFAEVGLRRVINNARPIEGMAARDDPGVARTFGFIGTVAEWKGIGQLLEAFCAVAAEADVPPLRLLVAGDGDPAYVDALRTRYASDRIEFLGRMKPASFYERIDVSVVPSIWHDPLPGVVFESMLFGVPVIGARRGGIPEMVTDRLNGLLYEPDAAGALAACLRELATSEGLVGVLGRQARAGSGRFADMGRLVSEHMAVYDVVAGA
jgi:glycosyltransferase involved in cell wall biosynthesis